MERGEEPEECRKIGWIFFLSQIQVLGMCRTIRAHDASVAAYFNVPKGQASVSVSHIHAETAQHASASALIKGVVSCLSAPALERHIGLQNSLSR